VVAACLRRMATRQRPRAHWSPAGETLLRSAAPCACAARDQCKDCWGTRHPRSGAARRCGPPGRTADVHTHHGASPGRLSRLVDGCRQCACPCLLHRQRRPPILGSSCNPDFCRAFWGTGGATEKSARPWGMRARGADPCRFCARLQQLRAAQRSCAAGKTPQKFAGLARYNFAQCGIRGRWHAWALHACFRARFPQLRVSQSCCEAGT